MERRHLLSRDRHQHHHHGGRGDRPQGGYELGQPRPQGGQDGGEPFLVAIVDVAYCIGAQADNV